MRVQPRTILPAILAVAVSAGCPRTEHPAVTAASSVSTSDAPPSPARTVPASDNPALIAAEVNALVEQAAAGNPTTVTLALEYIFGWGCDCPPFVFRASGGQTEYDEEYVFPAFADGAPDAVYPVRGDFDLVGHYTGRRIDMFRWNEERGTPVAPDAVHPEELEFWRSLHPAFVVLEWCYRPPARPVEPDWEVPLMTQMRTADVPLCPGATWPAWLDEPASPDE